MFGVRPCPLPEASLLQRYAEEGAFTDSYCVELASPASHAAFVEAFYTTPLFRLERALLRWFAGRPSTDLDAREVAQGAAQRFAAWDVEARVSDQILLRDYTGRTRSWLMVAPAAGHAYGTRLIFGSAVVPARSRSGPPKMGTAFTLLMPLHRLYSRLLLASARRRLRTRPPQSTD